MNLLRLRMVDKLNIFQGGESLIGILSAAYGVLISVMITGMFYGHYESLVNTVDSVALPAAVAAIFFVKHIYLKIY